MFCYLEKAFELVALGVVGFVKLDLFPAAEVEVVEFVL